jgi:2-polyprenyl-6-methoxyphenol hydroxylase-like FAD-dependent oxidoreductase
MANIERILIVGGGIAGLTLARALHQQGFRAELVERSPTWQAAGAAIQLAANAMRVLHALDLVEAVEQSGTVIRHWLYCDQHGEVLCDTDLEEVWSSVGSCIAIDRPLLQHILVSGAAATPFRLGTSIVSLSQDAQQVQVDFSDGSTCAYDLVVGADGVSSTIRTMVMGAVQSDYTGAMIWRSLVPVPPSDTTNFKIMFGDGCFFGITPISHGQPTNVFGAIGMPRTLDPMQGRLERFRQRFAGFGGQVQKCLAALSSDEQIYSGPVEEIKLDRWHQGRVVLIGDAAHAGAPTMGQGGCMAMEDAWVLAEVLRQAETVESALDSYENRRKPRVTWVQQQSRNILESFLMPSAQRNSALRECGSRIMHDSFKPLIPGP